jgi:excinuclease ABC subunit C
MMKGAKGEILYVGKAKDLRSRVRSYFQKVPKDQRYAVRFLAGRTADIDCIITSSEKEALILEETLLKTHRPRYNIRLKDDKSSLSIKITNERFPRILVTRKRLKDGARYFGPYPSASMARETIKFLRKAFPLRVCGEAEFRNRLRPCLDHQLGICSAPATGLITEEAYAELVRGAVMFLEGKNRELVRELKKRMALASDSLDFEAAARLRDRISAIEETLEEQKVVSASSRDSDVLGHASDDGNLAVKVLTIREGRLVGGADYFFTDARVPIEEVFSSFISQYYKGDRFIPDEVLTSVKPLDAEFLSSWLGERKGARVELARPMRGFKRGLVEMAVRNAAETLRQRTLAAVGALEVVDALARRLKLSRSPRLIEAFDISNIGDEDAVAGMVAFKDGEPYRDGYRLFRITRAGQDDFAMLFEALSRRYAGRNDLPDMILIDGGKGQLSSALAVLDELGIECVEVASLAKDSASGSGKDRFNRPVRKGERVFRPNVKDAVLLKEGSPADLLLRRIRDEVHRFAVSYHRKLRGKRLVRSALDGVPGIGPTRRKALLERFGSIDAMRDATVDELSRAAGMTPKLAERLKLALGGAGQDETSEKRHFGGNSP